MLGRIFSGLILGSFISICGGGMIALVATLTNLPRILIGLSIMWRFLLRTSYFAYAWLIARFQPTLMNFTGVNLHTKLPRAMACTLLSIGLGWGAVTLLGWAFNIWWFVVFCVHGLLIGLAWRRIIQPEEFQLGEELH